MCHPTESYTKTASQKFMDFLDFIKIRFVAEKVPFTSRFSESLNVPSTLHSDQAWLLSSKECNAMPKSETK